MIKVEQEEYFPPVTITITTKQEVHALINALRDVRNPYGSHYLNSLDSLLIDLKKIK